MDKSKDGSEAADSPQSENKELNQWLLFGNQETRRRFLKHAVGMRHSSGCGHTRDRGCALAP
ncbi:MAG: hypothetical protein DMF04_05340 [Verrucomicrobia bacterium]|nr:MAG: hypothetical protein DMF04_05340 [Verrucomicrobiota bacterium]